MIPLYGRYQTNLTQTKRIIATAANFLPIETTEQIRNLLKTGDSSTIVKSVNLLEDGKVKVAITNKLSELSNLGVVPEGQVEFKFKKTALTVDAKTGRVIDFKQPFYLFFRSLNSVMEKMGKSLKNASENTKNPDVVQKNFLQIA